MLRKFIVLLSLVLTLGFVASTSAAAQDIPDIDTPEFEGLETGYMRMYMPDLSAMFETIGTPGAEMPEFDMSDMMIGMTSIMTFDNEDNAAKALETYGDALSEQAGESDTIEPTDIKDLGDKAVLYSGEIDADGDVLATNIVLVQNDKMVFMAMIAGGEPEAGEQKAKDIVQFMMDTEPTTDEVTLTDGTGSGGAFDRMPTPANSDLLDGLVPFIDADMNDPSSGLGL